LPEYIASCAIGLEKVLANELRSLGLRIVRSDRGRLRFAGDSSSVPYKANLCLRTAERVMLLAAEYSCPDFDALFEGAASAAWEDYFPPDARIVIDAPKIRTSRLSSVPAVQAVVQKALATRLCGKFRVRRLPETGKKAGVRVHIERDRIELCIDLSGESLHKRGYRGEAVGAPLKETVAAGIILLSNWRRKYPLIDPFCGSGTIPIEALLYALNVAPGIGRRFAMEALAFWDPATDAETRAALRAAVRTDCAVRILGSDANPEAVAIAERNLRAAFRVAGLSEARPSDYLGFAVVPMEKLERPTEGPGYIVTNPPYGIRMGDADEAAATYRAMRSLASAFPGWKLAVLSAHAGFEEAFGSKPESSHEIWNGASRAALRVYRLGA
jgi:putative N6-adenine-specific DNA methylase